MPQDIVRHTFQRLLTPYRAITTSALTKHVRPSLDFNVLIIECGKDLKLDLI
jgi:hypothetical protein